VGDDLAVKFGLPFTSLVKPKRGETVVFSWVVFKSRAHRDKVNAKVMADKRLQKMPKNMPFDVKRMTYGGFKTLVEAYDGGERLAEPLRLFADQQLEGSVDTHAMPPNEPFAAG
jgi:hypothetical protein